MTTSDSESFESADEGIGDTDSQASKIVKIAGHSRHGNAPQNEKKLPNKEEILGVKQSTSVHNEKSKSTAHDNVKNEQDLGMKEDKKPEVDDGWEDFDDEVEEESPLQQKEAVDFKEKSEDVKEKTEDANNQDEGWDFDDWGDEDIQSHVANKPETVHTEKEFKELADKLSSLNASGSKGSEEEDKGWSGWGGWGAKLISSGVSQITTHVSQGLNTMSSVIESGMGVPDPEELVKIQKESRLKREEQLQKSSSQTSDTGDPIEASQRKSSSGGIDADNYQQDNSGGGFQLGKLVSSVTKLVESTGTTVITGGLDTLEEIGKRTMKVIQGDEPEGRIKLSTLLREARDKREEQERNMPSGDFQRKKPPSFETLFDDFQGLVHLEALEMLSKQCELKIQSLFNKYHGEELKELQETLEQVKEICELPDYENEETFENNTEFLHGQLKDATKDLGIELNFELILNFWNELFVFTNQSDDTTLNENDEDKVETLSRLAINNIAHYSALSVQVLHKCAALLSVRDRRSTTDEADGLTQLTVLLCHHISEIANIFSNRLNSLSQQQENADKSATAMTNVFLEADKGSSYVKDAFSLTIPILQVGAT